MDSSQSNQPTSKNWLAGILVFLLLIRATNIIFFETFYQRTTLLAEELYSAVHQFKELLSCGVCV